MKKTIEENFRVEVTPDIWFDSERTPEEYYKRCNALLHDIKRHVDGIDMISIECDTKEICEFCNGEWEEEDNGQPVCCGKAVDEWKLKTYRQHKEESND